LEGVGGCSRVTDGAAVLMVKVTLLLLPAGFPSELGWVAIAV
jgi:hypothetical protein